MIDYWEKMIYITKEDLDIDKKLRHSAFCWFNQHSQEKHYHIDASYKTIDISRQVLK